jgi:acetyl-CoA C-acetyltransferase
MSANRIQDGRIAIVAATRTPIGSFGGCFRTVSACELAAVAIRGALAMASLEPTDVGEVILGNVLQAGLGPNPARRAAVLAEIPYEVPAFTVNKVCGSGLKAIVLAADAIRLGRIDIAVAGGMESMSAAPHLIPDLRWGKRSGESRILDSKIHDALWDCFYDCHMATTAEELATTYGISRGDQDAFACESQHRYAAVLAAAKWTTEIVPVSVPQRKGEILLVDRDEYPRSNVTLEALAQLAPAFSRTGTITAGNASGINDGAAVVVLANERECETRGLQPLAWIGDDVSVGVDPMKMGIGPAYAIRRLAERAKRSLHEYDLFEINEAFAAQVLAVCGELKLADRTKLNVNGGAIALGHPVGASGARIVVSLAHEMNRRKCRRGIASACIGGGMGIATELVRF